MSLLTLRLLGAGRALLRRPAWSAFALLLTGLVLYGGFRAVSAGTLWLMAYPLIDSIAPAVIKRSLEGLFLMLMAAVMFSVLTASIGILYGSDDLQLLLAQPVRSGRVFLMKIAELFVNAAGLPLLFTMPFLTGVGVALGAPALYYPVSFLAVLALYTLPVTAGALLALVLVRFSPAGRVREVATALSIVLAAAAVLALRALRPEQLLQLDFQDNEAFEAFLRTFTSLDLGWLPPAWAAGASWAALSGKLHAGLPALLLLGAAGLLLTGLLARLAYERGWVRSIDTAPATGGRGRTREGRAGRFLAKVLGPVGALLARDARMFLRDVQQWSQLLVLAALVAVYFVSLSAIPVPGQQFRDVLGALNVAFMVFISAGVGVRIAWPAVSLEGGAYWLMQVQPLKARHIVTAKFLFVLPVMLALSGGLAFAANRLLEMNPLLGTASAAAAVSAAIALSGLGVGLGAAQPQFRHLNPNELALSPGALTYMAFSLLYATALTVLLARPAWSVVSSQAGSGYWASGEGLLLMVLLGLLTLVTAAVPLVHGSRRLARYEEE